MTEDDNHEDGEPMELLDFLRARLDEDERVARAAARRHGHWLQGFGPEADASEIYEVTQEELDRADGCEGNHPIGSPNPCEFNVLMTPGAALEALPVMDDVAAHIVRHDPARVLAEVAAKRAILALHLPTTSPWHLGETDDGGYGTINPACPSCGTPSEYAVQAPCPTLCALALPYADHPDYDDAWKP